MNVFKFFIIFLFMNSAYAQSTQGIARLASATAKVDLKCMNFKVEGACAVGPAPGIIISYWEPTLLMETIDDSGNGWQSMANSSLDFNEVHLNDFPLKILEQAVLCPSEPNLTAGIRYRSEMDRSQWRKESIGAPLKASQFVGNWGPLYPRTGFVVQSNPAVASALTSLRAISAAGMLTRGSHVVASPLDFGINVFTDKMQMVYPEKGMCMAPGTDHRLWNIQRASKDGDYVWIYFKFRRCCKPIPVPV